MSGETENDILHLSKLLFAGILQFRRWPGLLGHLVE